MMTPDNLPEGTLTSSGTTISQGENVCAYISKQTKSHKESLLGGQGARVMMWSLWVDTLASTENQPQMPEKKTN